MPLSWCTIRQPVTITGTDHVRAASAPPGLKKVKQNNDPMTMTVTVKEPESKVNLYLTSTEGEVEGCSGGRPELREGYNEPLHFLGSLGESALERGGG